MTWLGRILHQGCERQTTAGRAAKGLAIGSLVGAALVSSVFVVMMPPMAIPVFMVAFVVWAFGLFAVAAPGWWLLHRLGARCQQAAMIYGGGLTLLVSLPFGPFPIATNLGFALAGALIGWIVARVAYEPAAPA